MLFLTIDTSGRSGGLTLAEGDQAALSIIESASIAGGTFSAQLIPTLGSILDKHRLVPSALAGFVAVSGPGSFTGLRIGLSAVKGLAEIVERPVALISLLEALAISGGLSGRVAGALDAGRHEVYFGVYEVMGGRGSVITEELLSNAEFLQSIRDTPVRVISSDRGVVEFAANHGVEILETRRPGSEDIARIGLRKLLDGQIIDVEQLDANYIRRSDAEIFSPANAQKSGTLVKRN